VGRWPKRGSIAATDSGAIVGLDLRSGIPANMVGCRKCAMRERQSTWRSSFGASGTPDSSNACRAARYCGDNARRVKVETTSCNDALEFQIDRDQAGGPALLRPTRESRSANLAVRAGGGRAFRRMVRS